MNLLPMVFHRDAMVPEPGYPSIAPVWNEAFEQVGTLRLHAAANNAVYISWEIDPPFQRQGYAVQAARMVIPHLLRNFHRVIATMAPSNAASKKVAEKLGFKYEGRARESRQDKYGNWVDMDIYSLLQADWRAASWVGKSH